jgi:hypothetical protein
MLISPLLKWHRKLAFGPLLYRSHPFRTERPCHRAGALHLASGQLVWIEFDLVF